MGENIGATARIMKNFDISDLRIVSPRDGWPNQKANDMAANAEDIILNAKIFDNLEEAISDINYLVSTSSSKRYINKDVITPHEASLKIIDLLSHKKCGILFGKESHGLSNKEISYSNQMVSITVSENYNSLNLAQAVCVLLYEIFKNYNSNNINKLKNNLFSEEKISKKNLPADKKEYIEMINFLEKKLENNNFFQVKEKKENMIINITNMFTKNNFTEQEIRTLKGIFALIK